MGFSQIFQSTSQMIRIGKFTLLLNHLLNQHQYKRIHQSQQMQKEQNKEVAQDKTLTFHEYSSLELATRDKFINLVRKEGYDDKDILWVASEKIHGSNFSIFFNGQTVCYGRRTDFLTKEIPVPCENPGGYFNESFYDARKLVAKFHNKLPDVYKSIKEYDPKMIKFAIYGEYFGGNWPVEDPNYIKGGPKQVQKGVYYTPNHEFFAFDINIVTDEKVYWVDVLDIPQLLKDNISSVPVYLKGTFEEVFNMDILLDSTIPPLLGLPKLEKNIIEGMVIRPNKNLRLPTIDARVIIKKKNQEFLEKVAEPTKKKGGDKKEKGVDPKIAPFLEELLKYLNFNRIDSVVSKYPDLKDRNKLKDLVSKDIISDAEKEEFKFPPTQEDHNLLLKEFNAVIMKEINSYFIKH